MHILTESTFNSGQPHFYFTFPYQEGSSNRPDSIPYLSRDISQASLPFPGGVKHRRGVDDQIQPTETLLDTVRSSTDVLLSVHIQPEDRQSATVLVGQVSQLGRSVRVSACRYDDSRGFASQDMFAEFKPQSSAGSLNECDGGSHDTEMTQHCRIGSVCCL